MQNEYSIVSQRNLRASKHINRVWFVRFIIAYAICIGLYFIYMFAFQGLSISYVGGIQKEYGKFLVESNDEFVQMMVEFEVLTTKTESVYLEEEKEQIRQNLNRQNEFLKKMQKFSPDETNMDYLDLYQDMLQIYAFYIQGETMKAEYCYKYDDNFTIENEFSGENASIEQYTMGQELCNMMGNMILNNYKYINQIRNTTYSSKYNILEIGGGSSSDSNNSNSDTNDNTNNETENKGE